MAASIHRSLFLLLILALPVLLIVFYLHNRMPEFPSPLISDRMQPPKSTSKKMDMTGFHYTGHDSDGRKAISIEGERITVEKKKMGFVSTALADQVIMRDATIGLYFEKPLRSNGPVSTPISVIEDVLAMPRLSDKKISSVRIEPVRLNLFESGSLATRIQASSALIRLIQKEILFIGKVEVRSGAKILYTERLAMTADGTLKTHKKFILSASGEKRSGTSFLSDLFLNTNPY